MLELQAFRLLILLDEPNKNCETVWTSSPVFQACVQLSVVRPQHKHNVEPAFWEEVAAVVVHNHAAFSHLLFQFVHHLEGSTQWTKCKLQFLGVLGQIFGYSCYWRFLVEETIYCDSRLNSYFYLFMSLYWQSFVHFKRPLGNDNHSKSFGFTHNALKS